MLRYVAMQILVLVLEYFLCKKYPYYYAFSFYMGKGNLLSQSLYVFYVKNSKPQMLFVGKGNSRQYRIGQSYTRFAYLSFAEYNPITSDMTQQECVGSWGPELFKLNYGGKGLIRLEIPICETRRNFGEASEIIFCVRSLLGVTHLWQVPS